MRLTRILIATVIASLGFTGASVAAPAAGQHYKIIVTDPKSGVQIEIPDGDRLLLRLTACEDCGNRWKIQQKPNAAVVAFDKRLKSVHKGSCTSPCVGGYVYERFRFLSKAVGTTTVKLGYFVQGSTKPAKTMRLRLTVVA